MYCWGNAVVILLRCCCTVDVMLVLCCIIVGVLFPMRCCTMHALPALRWCVVYTLLPCAVDTLLIRCWCTHDMLLCWYIFCVIYLRLVYIWRVVAVFLVLCCCAVVGVWLVYTYCLYNVGVILVYGWCYGDASLACWCVVGLWLLWCSCTCAVMILRLCRCCISGVLFALFTVCWYTFGILLMHCWGVVDVRCDVIAVMLVCCCCTIGVVFMHIRCYRRDVGVMRVGYCVIVVILVRWYCMIVPCLCYAGALFVRYRCVAAVFVTCGCAVAGRLVWCRCAVDVLTGGVVLLYVWYYREVAVLLLLCRYSFGVLSLLYLHGVTITYCTSSVLIM